MTAIIVKFMGSNMLAQMLGERIELGKEGRNKSKLYGGRERPRNVHVLSKFPKEAISYHGCSRL